MGEGTLDGAVILKAKDGADLASTKLVFKEGEKTKLIDLLKDFIRSV